MGAGVTRGRGLSTFNRHLVETRYGGVVRYTDGSKVAKDGRGATSPQPRKTPVGKDPYAPTGD